MQKHSQNVVTITNITNSRRLANSLIGMRDTLRALGYSEGAAIGKMQHRAGNDSARVIAIFLNLVNVDPDAPTLQLQVSESWRRHKNQKFLKRSVFDTRPYPLEEYPFTVRLSRSGAELPPASAILNLKDFFGFQITALGIRPQEESPRFCWICLPSMDVLRDFVQHVNSLGPRHSRHCPGFRRGCRCDPTQHIWEAEMCLQPGTEGWSDQEWKKLGDQAKEKSRARKAEEARLTRERRKENKSTLRQGVMKLEEEDYCISWGNDDDGDGEKGMPRSVLDATAGHKQKTEEPAKVDQFVVDMEEETVDSIDECEDDAKDMVYLMRRIQE